MANISKDFPYSKADFKFLMRAEKAVKGFAHYRRLALLKALAKTPGRTVSELADRLGADMQITSQHLQKMISSGLVYREIDGNFVRLYLSPVGKKAHLFAEKLIELV